MKIIQDFLPTTLPTRPGKPMKPAYITIHNTDNVTKGAGAAAHNRYIRGPDAVARRVSWHFTVDDRAIYQHLPTNEVGYHANTAAGNSTIGVEICMNSDMDVSTAYANAAELVATTASTLGLKLPAYLKQHHDWSGKNCPSAIRNGSAMSWPAFVALCQKATPAAPGNKSVAKMTMDFAVPDWMPAEADAILESIDASMAGHGGDELPS